MGSAHDVADHATDTGVGTTERLDRRWVVVRLRFHGDGRAFGERHDAGVADEGAAQERRVDGGRCVAQLLQERRDCLAVVAGDARPERLVRAVLAPRLGERLQLDVGRSATVPAEVSGNRAQLGRGPATGRVHG